MSFTVVMVLLMMPMTASAVSVIADESLETSEAQSRPSSEVRSSTVDSNNSLADGELLLYLPIAAAPFNEVTTNEDTPVTIQFPGQGGNRSGLTYNIVAGPDNGIISGDSPAVIYTPNSNFSGYDSITVEVLDGSITLDVANITIRVLALNDPPAATKDAYDVDENGELFVPASGVLSNDDDVDGGDVLSAELVTDAANGVVFLNGDGSFTYRPDRHFNGVDSFTYRAIDAQGASSDVTTVSLVVRPDSFLTVTNTNDSGPGSLRAALELANRQPDVDTIIFEIEGTGPHTISLLSALPDIIAPVIIDGLQQQNPPPLPPGSIILDGSAIADSANGLTVTAGESTITGLTITGFGGSALLISGGGNSTVTENQLTNNGIGVLIQDSSGNQIKENAITANGLGILMRDSSNNMIDGNVISDTTGSYSVTIEREDEVDNIIVTGGGVVIIGDGTDEGTLSATGDNTVENNVIAGNVGNGITIVDSANNQLNNNDIYANTGAPIDLGGDGESANDPQDIDIGANFVQNHPVLNRATPDGSQIRLEGRLNSKPNQTYTIQIFSSPTCDATKTLLNDEPITVFTDANGDILFDLTLPSEVSLGTAVSATATDSNGNTSELSDCIIVSADNDSWPRALTISPGTPIEQYLDLPGRSRWYRFSALPETKVTVALTNLPANYDLTVYKDIANAYRDVLTPQDLPRLSAEFAPSAFSPSAFSPSAFSPSAFSPSAFSPSAFSPSAFSPSAFSPSAFSPSAFSPSAFSPSAFSPSAFSPEAFESAQTRSLIGISAFDETASEGIVLNTWNNNGDIYLRVRGREDAFSADQAFNLLVTTEEAACSGLDLATDPLPDSNIEGVQGSFKTLILVDKTRLSDEAMNNRLEQLAGHQEVQGKVIDVSQDARVVKANQLADLYRGCPYAKNLVADAIKIVVDRYWAANRNTLQYIVIIGNDDAIPFFRYPDNALLGHESNFVPPVIDDTTSQASLRLGYVLGQDAYGAPYSISTNATQFPIPGLSIGRLVETPADIINMVDAYLATANGVVTPGSGFVTGYDFLEDAAIAMQGEFEGGLGTSVETLITPQNVSPFDEDGGPNPAAWSADDLKGRLLNNRYDLIFLAGHFNAASALAADFTTSVLSTDVLNSPVDMTNVIVMSAGCHSGYNIVNEHGVPNVTFEPDWAQVFAQKGTTFIGGTGYQYGDTEFLEYSERLYLNVAEELRRADQVAVGDALVAAKKRYLATTPVLRGIHEKAVLQATLFGLPMLRVDLPTAPVAPPSDASVIGGTNSYPSEPPTPASVLGLTYVDVNVVPSLQERTIELTNVDSGETVPATWLQADSGIVTNPAEPVLPLQRLNVSVNDRVLRGVGFRGAVYNDKADVQPLTGAPTTEIRGVYAPFLSDVFFPIRPWNVNYFGALNGNDTTFLNVTPAQHQSTAPGAITSTRRSYSSIDFRLFYSSYVSPPGSESRPELADAPAIVGVSTSVNGNELLFEANVIGNPAAGIQEVWITYTAQEGDLRGVWQSLDLVQDANVSTLWRGTLPLNGTSPEDIRFVVQAVNGVGLVALTTNQGRYYVPGDGPPRQKTRPVIEPFSVGSGRFGNTTSFSARLETSEGVPIVNESVSFGLGLSTRSARTDGSGIATVSMPILAVPGEYRITAFFDGTTQYAPAAATSNEVFDIQRQESSILLSTVDHASNANGGQLLKATLYEGSGPLNDDSLRQVERTIRFTIIGNGIEIGRSVITNLVGDAYLDALTLPDGSPLPSGFYTVQATFEGTQTHEPVPAKPGDPPVATTIDIISADPTDITLSSDNVDENASIGTQVGVFSSTDVDSASFIYTFVDDGAGPDNGSFAIDGDKLKTAVVFDSQTKDSYTIKVRSDDQEGGSFDKVFTITINEVSEPPNCDAAMVEPASIWSPEGNLITVRIVNVFDPEADNVSVVIDDICQDEPVGTNEEGADAFLDLEDPASAQIRAERYGWGNGRVYTLFFTATDASGATCTGIIEGPIVPHDQDDDDDDDDSSAVNDGALYDSLTAGAQLNSCRQ